MGQIAVLPQTLINQIAAGEVIVRPASAVKELVENSLDAGARRIAVLVSNSARDITIIDDGSGMDRDDAELALQRHATSKIRTVEDLSRIHTRGFRGEAVPSIASVARVEILTRPHDALAGTRVRIEGGRIEEIASAGCPPGTRFEVRDLFYNTPARLKFLKSPRSELNSIIQIVTLQALSRPEVGWRVEVDSRTLFDIPPDQSLLDRARELWGPQVGDSLFPIAGKRHAIRLEGVLGRPELGRRDRRHQAFFVNRRPIVSRLLSASLLEAYRGLLMVGRQPTAALFIEIDPEQVDVNVHPTKEEVRFRDEHAVAGSMYRLLVEGLRSAQLIPGFSASAPGDHAPRTGATSLTVPQDSPELPLFFTSPDALARPGALRKPTDFVGYAPARGEQTDWFGPVSTLGPSQDSMRGGEQHMAADASAYPSPFQQSSASLSAAEREESRLLAAPLWDQFGDPEPLGQIASTYIIARFGDAMLLIDQHAAHEKILYLQILSRREAPVRQPLLLPLTIEVAPGDMPAMQDLLPLLNELGLEIEEFGGRDFIVRAIPAHLDGLDIEGLVADLLSAEDTPGRGRRAPIEERRHRVAARMACRAAIKAGRALSIEEMKALIADLRRNRDAITCPHGRPTMILITRIELERRFGRVE